MRAMGCEAVFHSTMWIEFNAFMAWKYDFGTNTNTGHHWTVGYPKLLQPLALVYRYCMSIASG